MSERPDLERIQKDWTWPGNSHPDSIQAVILSIVTYALGLEAENTRLAAELADLRDQLTAYRACAETDASLNGNLGTLLAEARAELAATRGALKKRLRPFCSAHGVVQAGHRCRDFDGYEWQVEDIDPSLAAGRAAREGSRWSAG